MRSVHSRSAEFSTGERLGGGSSMQPSLQQLGAPTPADSDVCDVSRHAGRHTLRNSSSTVPSGTELSSSRMMPSCRLGSKGEPTPAFADEEMDDYTGIKKRWRCCHGSCPHAAAACSPPCTQHE